MKNRQPIFKVILKWLPKKRHLHGGMLHKIVGDRLFDPRIWNFGKKSVAGGLAVGTFVALTPTFPLQMILAGIMAYSMKVNMPIALMACWITNPITMPIIYALEYKIGEIVSQAFSLPDISDFSQHTVETEKVIEQMDLPKSKSFFTNSMPIVKNIFIGSTICSLIISIAVYFGTYFILSIFKGRTKQFESHLNDGD